MFENTFEELGVYNFTMELWAAGSLTVFGIQTRTWAIEKEREKIRQYAIGYTVGDKLWFRPKEDTFAVMFWYNGKHFWTHLTTKEFFICFPELKNIED